MTDRTLGGICRLDWFILKFLYRLPPRSQMMFGQIAACLDLESGGSYSSNQIKGRLRALENRKLVYKAVEDSHLFRLGYIAAFWGITPEGRAAYRAIAKSNNCDLRSRRHRYSAK